MSETKKNDERDNYSHMCHICAKGFVRFHSFEIKQLLTKYNFSQYRPKFHVFARFIFFFQVLLEAFRPAASTLQMLWQEHARNLMAGTCQESTVNIFASCDSLTFVL